MLITINKAYYFLYSFVFSICYITTTQDLVLLYKVTRLIIIISILFTCNYLTFVFNSHSVLIEFQIFKSTLSLRNYLEVMSNCFHFHLSKIYPRHKDEINPVSMILILIMTKHDILSK